MSPYTRRVETENLPREIEEVLSESEKVMGGNEIPDRENFQRLQRNKQRC
jgi:hypothetical protein